MDVELLLHCIKTVHNDTFIVRDKDNSTLIAQQCLNEVKKQIWAGKKYKKVGSEQVHFSAGHMKNQVRGKIRSNLMSQQDSQPKQLTLLDVRMAVLSLLAERCGNGTGYSSCRVTIILEMHFAVSSDNSSGICLCSSTEGPVEGREYDQKNFLCSARIYDLDKYIMNAAQTDFIHLTFAELYKWF